MRYPTQRRSQHVALLPAAQITISNLLDLDHISGVILTVTPPLRSCCSLLDRLACSSVKPSARWSSEQSICVLIDLR